MLCRSATTSASRAWRRRTFMSPSSVAYRAYSCSLISSDSSLACPRSVDRPLLRWSFDIGFLLLSATPAHHFPASLPSGGFTLGASSFVTPWGLITHSRFLPFVRRAHHRHLPSFSRPDLLAAAVELCLALPAAALGLVLLLLRPPLAYVSSARTPSFRAFGPPVCHLCL